MHCPAARGWAQIDTSRDAPWFGTWTHPETLRIVRFIEGEMTVQIAATAAEYVAEMRRQVAWHAGQGHAFAIDPMLRDDIEAQLRALGLDDLLH